MRRSRLEAVRLQNLRPEAWGALLDKGINSQGIRVTSVDIEPVGRWNHLTRYVLTLEGQQDPVTLLGKVTTVDEVNFYREIAGQIPFLVPHCWFGDIHGDEGWIVIDDVPNDVPSALWTGENVEEIIEELAFLHAIFWQREELLDSFDWLPRYLGRDRQANLLYEAPETPPYPHGHGNLVSDHALKSVGRLAPRLLRAASGVELLRDLGGWPGVIEPHHLDAAIDLLDDPVPVLDPLRQLPVTLIHSFPSIQHWRLTLFDDRRLVDWRRPAIGPSICDLVAFLEPMNLIVDGNGSWRLRPDDNQPASEQTIVDSYLLRMSSELGARFRARDLRRALPAARCLYVMTEWFPRFSTWFAERPNGRLDWNQLINADSQTLAPASHHQLFRIKPYLSQIFQRFLLAYRTL